jgi:PncC family amidohydrolase
MAMGAKKALNSDLAVAVTGLAGPGGDEFGHPVGTVFIGYADETQAFAREYHFTGDRDSIRAQTVEAALRLILENI